MDKPIIGRREYVDLPDWGVEGLLAKIDSGARTSALHVENIQERPDGMVAFEVVLSRRRPDRRVSVVAEQVRIASVKPSSGRRQERPVVRTRMRLGQVEREIEISLVSRTHMLCRMLIGRNAIEGSFLIDVGAPYLLGRRSRRKKKSGASQPSRRDERTSS